MSAECPFVTLTGPRQSGYEIKSGATFSRDFFKGLNFWGSLSGADSTRKSVIYAGDRAMTTSDGLVVPWDCLFSSGILGYSLSTAFTL